MQTKPSVSIHLGVSTEPSESGLLVDPLLVKVRPNVALKLRPEQRLALVAPEPVPDRIVDRNLVEHGSVIEGHGEGVADKALLGVVVLGRVSPVLDALHLEQAEIG